MWVFFALLGFAVALIIAILSPLIVHWLAIPDSLKAGYQVFLMAYGAVFGCSMIVRPLTVLLFIHQRSDVSILTSSVGMILGFGVIWYLLTCDWELWSLLTGMIIPLIFSTAVITWQALKKNYVPRWKKDCSLSLPAFVEVFAYGKDRLLINSGLAILQAAPTFLITQTPGLEANVVWTVASRANQLCLQLITRLCDLSFPALVEMHVRGEHHTLQRRYSNLLIIGMGAAVFCAVGVALCNSQFVNLWTSGRIHSSRLLDGMLAIWLLCQALQRHLFIPVGISRTLTGLRSSYLLESGILVVLGLVYPSTDRRPLVATTNHFCCRFHCDHSSFRHNRRQCSTM